jgi:hypothetical protein
MSSCSVSFYRTLRRVAILADQGVSICLSDANRRAFESQDIETQTIGIAGPDPDLAEAFARMARFSADALLSSFTGAPSGVHTGGFTGEGWFIGGGVENNLNIFGISSPGWFMKTEYRAAYYGNKSLNALADGTNLPVGTLSTSTILWFRPSAPRWFTASTGVARSLPSTDFLLI